MAMAPSPSPADGSVTEPPSMATQQITVTPTYSSMPSSSGQPSISLSPSVSADPTLSEESSISVSAFPVNTRNDWAEQNTSSSNTPVRSNWTVTWIAVVLAILIEQKLF